MNTDKPMLKFKVQPITVVSWIENEIKSCDDAIEKNTRYFESSGHSCDFYDSCIKASFEKLFVFFSLFGIFADFNCVKNYYFDLLNQYKELFEVLHARVDVKKTLFQEMDDGE